MAPPVEQHADRSGLIKPFIEHLRDLRTMLMRSVIALAVGMAVSAPFAPRIVSAMKYPLIKAGADPDQLLRTLELTGGFSIAMKVITLCGLILAVPFIVIFVCQFVFPGLTAKERRSVTRGLLAVAVLFVAGVVFGYFLVLPVAIKALLATGTWIGIAPGPITIASHASFCLLILLGFGVAMEMPAVLVLLGTMGLVSSGFLRAKRRHAVIVILVLAMILTPPDVVSQLLMTAPLLVLYEASIWIIRGHELARRT